MGTLGEVVGVAPHLVAGEGYRAGCSGRLGVMERTHRVWAGGCWVLGV